MVPAVQRQHYSRVGIVPRVVLTIRKLYLACRPHADAEVAFVASRAAAAVKRKHPLKGITRRVRCAVKPHVDREIPRVDWLVGHIESQIVCAYTPDIVAGIELAVREKLPAWDKHPCPSADSVIESVVKMQEQVGLHRLRLFACSTISSHSCATSEAVSDLLYMRISLMMYVRDWLPGVVLSSTLTLVLTFPLMGDVPRE